VQTALKVTRYYIIWQTQSRHTWTFLFNWPAVQVGSNRPTQNHAVDNFNRFFFTGLLPFLLPNQQFRVLKRTQSTNANHPLDLILHPLDLIHPRSIKTWQPREGRHALYDGSVMTLADRVKVFISHSTQNRSFRRCSSQQISGHSSEETKSNTTKAPKHK